MEDSESGYFRGEHTLKFSKDTFWEKTKRMGLFVFPSEMPTFFTILVALLGVSEVITKGNDRITFIDVLWPSLIVSFVVAGYRAVYSYSTYCPEELQSELDVVKKTYRLKKVAWQYVMARAMLKSRIEVHRNSISRIQRGAEYVGPLKLDVQEYIRWGSLRSTAIPRLLNAVIIQFANELPTVISDLEDGVTLSEFKLRLDYIGELCQEIRNIELESYRVLPPEGFEVAHSYTRGWTDPISFAINEFLGFLDSASEVTEESLKAGNIQIPAISVVINTVPHLDDYIEAMTEAVSLYASDNL
ncbi:hypothetical protein [Stutzerimonas zhaodongensis]|uniref:hypothetical protein n=1 Tax=Stutzerimonas zhaodongensis TaxID=1176257 RepID=UPI0021069916|nr:hypothetical protein [Stutzerimonas zhaodongensis]MCQ2031605.1 hypothetical protein [Stutzerimonas zhaodongensis]